jgi:hypothetical protein
MTTGSTSVGFVYKNGVATGLACRGQLKLLRGH